MITLLFILFVAVSVAEGLLLVRASKRLLQFDQILGEISPVLDEYSQELRKTLTGGLLEDHPEVMAFHHLNLRSLQAIEGIVESIKSGRPRKPELPNNYLRPEVE